MGCTHRRTTHTYTEVNLAMLELFYINMIHIGEYRAYEGMRRMEV
jgi:hypothetical protein